MKVTITFSAAIVVKLVTVAVLLNLAIITILYHQESKSFKVLFEKVLRNFQRNISSTVLAANGALNMMLHVIGLPVTMS